MLLLSYLLRVACCNAEDLLARAANDPEVEQQLIMRMRALLAPFVLRRLKSELAEQMVTKNHKLHEVRMSTCCSQRQHVFADTAYLNGLVVSSVILMACVDEGVATC